MSNGKDFPDNSNGNNKGGNNDEDRDDNDRAINMPNTAAAATTAAAAAAAAATTTAAATAAAIAAAAATNNDEGVLRKTLVTATIRRKMDAANADIPEGWASNGPTTKLRQYLSLTFEALAPPRSGCS